MTEQYATPRTQPAKPIETTTSEKDSDWNTGGVIGSAVGAAALVTVAVLLGKGWSLRTMKAGLLGMVIGGFLGNVLWKLVAPKKAEE